MPSAQRLPRSRRSLAAKSYRAVIELIVHLKGMATGELYFPSHPATQPVSTGTVGIEEHNPMNKLFARFTADESGATAIEYGLIAGLIAVVIIASVSLIGTRLSSKFNAIAANLS
jgi:pilus assembly protein Flp/PilA